MNISLPKEYVQNSFSKKKKKKKKNMNEIHWIVHTLKEKE